MKLTHLGRGSSDCDEIWHRWCSSAFLTVPTVKILKILKSKMAAAANLKKKIEKSQYLGLGSSDLDEIWHTDALPWYWYCFRRRGLIRRERQVLVCCMQLS